MADPTAKLFDDEADEEDDDLAPKEDEAVPEEEKNEYVVDGFVVGDDDEGLIPAPKPDGVSSSDDEDEDEGRLKRNREEDELADLQLIQDNLQQQEPKKQKRDAVDDLFADDSDDEPAKPVKKKDGLFDEDDFDDFIEDDLGIQQALKREHEASLKGARDGPATDVSQMQLMDMVCDSVRFIRVAAMTSGGERAARGLFSILSRFGPRRGRRCGNGVAAMASRATPSTRPRRAGEGSSARRDAVDACAPRALEARPSRRRLTSHHAGRHFWGRKTRRHE